MKPNIQVLADQPGTGAPVKRQHVYRIRLKLWLNRGESVRWQAPSGLIDHAGLEDDGATQVSDLRIDREHLIPGLFYGVEGMCIGGTRKLRIPPHLAYGERGVPDVIPPNAVLVAEITILSERSREHS